MKFASLALVGLLALGACSATQVASVCAKDASVVPAVDATATVVAPVVAAANPSAGAAVAGAAQLDANVVHPLVQADCAALTK